MSKGLGDIMIMRLDDLVIKFKSQNHGVTKSLNHRIYRVYNLKFTIIEGYFIRDNVVIIPCSLCAKAGGGVCRGA